MKNRFLILMLLLGVALSGPVAVSAEGDHPADCTKECCTKPEAEKAMKSGDECGDDCACSDTEMKAEKKTKAMAKAKMAKSAGDKSAMECKEGCEMACCTEGKADKKMAMEKCEEGCTMECCTSNGAKVASAAADTHPVAAGTKLPQVGSLRTVSGDDFSLADATASKKTVLVFYRGGWCPYCTRHLGEIAEITPRLQEAGVEVIALSPDSPETLQGYVAEHPLPYELVSDSSHEAAKAFGLAFAVDADTQTLYKGYGIDLQKASGSPDAVLPVPAVFVVEGGEITFAHADADYKVRMTTDDILAAAGVN